MISKADAEKLCEGLVGREVIAELYTNDEEPLVLPKDKFVRYDDGYCLKNLGLRVPPEALLELFSSWRGITLGLDSYSLESINSELDSCLLNDQRFVKLGLDSCLLNDQRFAN